MTTDLDSTAHRVGVYAWTPGTGGVHHYRIAEPLRVLAAHGNTAFHGVELHDEILSQVDTVLGHTLHDEQATTAWQALARLGTHRLVMDIDDAMWRPDWAPFKANYTPQVLRRLFDNIRVSHVVTTPSPIIAEYISRHANTNVWYVPNTIPAYLLDVEMPAREWPTVGYQGSPSHVRDWTAGATNGLARFLADHPQWGVHFYGASPGELARITDRVRHTPWSGSVDAYYRSLSMDVGIGPLRETYFNRCKSALRATEYAALGIVAVLPRLWPTSPYDGWVEDGVTGRLIDRGQTLRRVLTEVAADPDHMHKMSATARERARGWTTEANITRWVEAWHSR